jgi:hypothetical protein
MINNCGKKVKKTSKTRKIVQESENGEKNIQHRNTECLDNNGSLKENNAPYVLAQDKGDGLMVKEKEILRRINKIENYLNRP